MSGLLLWPPSFVLLPVWNQCRDALGVSFAKVALALYLVSIWSYINSIATAAKANIEMASEVAAGSQLDRMNEMTE